jgi:hypothetical protein
VKKVASANQSVGARFTIRAVNKLTRIGRRRHRAGRFIGSLTPDRGVIWPKWFAGFQRDSGGMEG